MKSKHVPKHIPRLIAEAFDLAKETRLNAHAPYSGFRVGAALVSDKKISTGCNVENASYGGTICAERTAIFKSVSDGVSSFTDIVIVTDAPKPAFPCAFCLQVMAEFFGSTALIWLADLVEIRSVYKFGELLPHRFGPEQLPKKLPKKPIEAKASTPVQRQPAPRTRKNKHT